MILTAFVLCIIPACILLALITTLLPILPTVLSSYEKIQDNATREELQRQRIADLQERQLTAQALREAKVAEANNKVMLQDIKIENEKLKERQLRQKLGMTSEEFTPRNYD